MPPRRWKKPHRAGEGDAHEAHGAEQYGAAGDQWQQQGSGGGGADSSAEPPGYVLFDGREDALLFWMELQAEEKEQLLLVEEADLGAALARATLGPDASDSALSIEPAKLQELVHNGELMTSVRCCFVDGIYESGKVKSMSDPGAPPSAEAASLDLILHSILSVIERRVLMAQFRSIVGNDLEQFRQPGKQVVVDPPALKSGDLVPFARART